MHPSMRKAWWCASLVALSTCRINEPDIPSPLGPLAPSPSQATTTSTPPTGPAATEITAPSIVSPPPGSVVDTRQPTLVVGNANGPEGASLNYSFRIWKDEALSDVAASVDGVPEGENGQTAWQVPTPLEPGRFFWGAQARRGGDFGPAPVTADFTIRAPVEPRPGGILISDALTTFSSIGEVSGGAFTRQGWQVTSKRDYIRYVVPPIPDGFVEWENRGFYPRNAAADQHILFGMWDPSRGAYRANPFRVHIQKLDENHNPPYIRLRWIADGEQHDSGFDFLDWDPRRVYRWRIDWGPEGNRNSARVFLDGRLIITVDYRNAYRPQLHWIELGVAEREESVVGAVYANFRVGSR